MLLSMDKNGNIYQAASHRPDGKGVERLPEFSGAGDVTLESPHYQEAVKREHENRLYQAACAQENLTEEVTKREKLAGIWFAKEQESKLRDNLHNPLVKQRLTEEALLQGMHGPDFDMLTAVSVGGPIRTYGKSSSGIQGKSLQQRGIEAALLQGMGVEPEVTDKGLVYATDESEIEQYKLLQEYAQTKKNSDNLPDPAIQISKPQTAVPAALPALHAPPGQVVQAVKDAVQEQKNQELLKYAAVIGLAVLLFRK